MKNAILSVLSFALVLGMLAVSAPVQAAEKKAVQTVRLSVVDDHYVVTPSKVTKGIPVRMDVDVQTVKGCAGTVVISAFGVRKTVRKEDATIEFVPNKTGTFEIACSMNMVKGALVVTAR